MNAIETAADQANAAWMEGSVSRALGILDQGIQDNTESLTLYKLRGDILATSRRDHEAIQAYESVLQKTPEALHVRWSKWSVLFRSGKADQAIAELQRISRHDVSNPLVPLRIAQELRKLDRLEESLEWYRKAVALNSQFPGWQLALARARFDVLDGRGARDEVKRVLESVSPGSPEEVAARSLLSVVYGATKERGRRYEPVFSPEGTAGERKEWAIIRADAWRFFEAKQYQEAEPLLRKVLDLKPSDYGATHDLGVTLMELDRCEEAIPVLEKVLTMTASDEAYADTFFRIGQCLGKLDRWSEALDHFEILYEGAVEFEKTIKEVRVAVGIRVLDSEFLAQWVEKARAHVPGSVRSKVDEANENIPFVDPSSPDTLTEEELYTKIASKTLKREDPVFRRASLMGRDADYSWFRFLIPSSQVMRDDLPGGAHEYIPIDPDDTFSSTQQDINLVFGLVSASFDEVPLSVECFLETPKITRDQAAVTQDHVVMSMNEQSGYFVLSRPEQGWTPGIVSLWIVCRK